MIDSHHFDVIIIGGSYAGLSAAMSLGRALRSVLVIDSGKPCNQQTPYSHNLITQDGRPPQEIATAAKAQVAQYRTITFYEGLAVSGLKTETGFEITTQAGDAFTAKKLIFATGLKDIMPDLVGFAACWGRSILHCPYCHGYEVRKQKTGLFGNGDLGFEFVKLISNWTKDLTLFTNGPATLTAAQTRQLTQHNVTVIEDEMESLVHNQGLVERVVLKNREPVAVKAIYARPSFGQHCPIPAALGCAVTEQGLLKVDTFQKTTVPGVYACGDNSSFARAIAAAVATGSFTGAAANKELIEEEF